MWHSNIMLEAILLTKWQFLTKARKYTVGKPIFPKPKKGKMVKKKTRLKTKKEMANSLSLDDFGHFFGICNKLKKIALSSLLRNNPFQGPIKAIIFSPTTPLNFPARPLYLCHALQGR